jgi:predicted Zn-dependent peptidase
MNKIFINKPGKTTIVIVMVRVGSGNETDDLKGISHFVEHTCFKGNPKRNQKQISSAIDNIGGELNAFTGEEITAYWAKVGNSYKDLALDVIVDLATKPTFPDTECEKEREVIVQELKMYEDKPANYVQEVFGKTVYAPGSRMYLPIVGTRESLKNIGKKELEKYHKDNYGDPTLIIVGDVKDKVEIPREQMGRWQRIELLSENHKTVNFVERNITQANIMLGNALKIDKFTRLEQIFLLELMDAIYRDMSGRLFDVIREKNNLVYSVHFGYDYLSSGYIQWHVSMGLNKDKISLARDLAIKELTRPATSQELDTAVAKSIGTLEMNLDDVTNVALTTAFSLVRGYYGPDIFDYKKYLKKMKKNVNEFIKLMEFDRFVLAGVVPK